MPREHLSLDERPLTLEALREAGYPGTKTSAASRAPEPAPPTLSPSERRPLGGAGGSTTPVEADPGAPSWGSR